MNKAILWNRDGVLNNLLSFRLSDGIKNASPRKFEDFTITENAKEVLYEIKKRGYLNIVHTNQPDIAREKMSLDELNLMHNFLKKQLPIDAIYVCPHGKYDHSDICQCRKPKAGMFFDAIKDFNLDVSQCYNIGDSKKDIEVGLVAGIKNIFLRTHYNDDFVFSEKKKVGIVYFEIKNIKEILNIVK